MLVPPSGYSVILQLQTSTLKPHPAAVGENDLHYASRVSSVVEWVVRAVHYLLPSLAVLSSCYQCFFPSLRTGSRRLLAMSVTSASHLGFKGSMSLRWVFQEVICGSEAFPGFTEESPLSLSRSRPSLEWSSTFWIKSQSSGSCRGPRFDSRMWRERSWTSIDSAR